MPAVSRSIPVFRFRVADNIFLKFGNLEGIYRGEPSALHPALEAAGGRAEDLGFGVYGV